MVSLPKHVLEFIIERLKAEHMERKRLKDVEELLKNYKHGLGQKQQQIEQYEESLRNIDDHIRSTSLPVPYIIEELKKSLPEYE